MIALDTNVLMYACDQQNAAKQKKALDLISAATEGVLLWQVACEFISASRKLTKQGFTSSAAWQRLSEYIALFPLVLPRPSVLEHARELHLSAGWSFWDGMIAAACLDAGVSRLYSEDLPGHQIEGLEIVNPFI